MTGEDAAYIAGLFEKQVVFILLKQKRKRITQRNGYRYSMSQRISMEITMTDEMVIRWVHEVLKCTELLSRNQEKVYVKMVQNT